MKRIKKQPQRRGFKYNEWKEFMAANMKAGACDPLKSLKESSDKVYVIKEGVLVSAVPTYFK